MNIYICGVLNMWGGGVYCVFTNFIYVHMHVACSDYYHYSSLFVKNYILYQF